ncbi:Mov34/MPN/PAD-1 family protein [bacterium]|nr:Mov34/MPN/PAD-1 family protein [bacterium]
MGLLIGEGNEVLDFVPLSNVHPCPTQAFALDEAELARHLGRGVVGLYHSHPGQEPRISTLDRFEGFVHYWVVDPVSQRWTYR